MTHSVLYIYHKFHVATITTWEEMFYDIILRWRRLFCMILTVHFTIFLPISLQTWRQSRRCIFFVIFQGYNRTYVWKYGWVSFLQIYNDKWKNDYSLWERSIITWWIKFLLIFKHSIAAACYLVFPWKLRDLK